MTAPHLIYFADPMCSWCYGFSPVMEDIRRAFGRALPVRLVMGGLRPGTETPMTQEAKDSLRGHWTHITEATGLPFGGAVLDDPGFLYDTDPAARAVHAQDKGTDPRVAFDAAQFIEEGTSLGNLPLDPDEPHAWRHPEVTAGPRQQRHDGEKYHAGGGEDQATTAPGRSSRAW